MGLFFLVKSMGEQYEFWQKRTAPCCQGKSTLRCRGVGAIIAHTQSAQQSAVFLVICGLVAGVRVSRHRRYIRSGAVTPIKPKTRARTMRAASQSRSLALLIS